ncbi:MAG: sigma-70 family RNA polymerase sigma factor [Actinomycetota bacterium]|nr:sigma-70 family RNA polymerase sigma factor [Actinomycetota bacterium]
MEDAELVARLRSGDEEAFRLVVERYHAALLRLAQTMVPTRAVAEEVVQDTWLGLVRGIGRFEGRSSLRTWLFHVLVNRARTTGVRERRPTMGVTAGPAVDPGRFGPNGGWADPPVPWPDDVDDRLVAAQLAERIRPKLDELPDMQRQVVLLRDVEGLSSAEVCDLLGLTEGNQRVLLHRGRSRLRGMLEAEMGKA